MDGQQHFPLPFDRHAPGMARHQLVLLGGDWPAGLLDSALLATSELVTNAIVHGGRDVTMVVRSSAGTIRVEVHDGGVESDVRPSPGRGGQDDEGGRGLYIVAAVADRWGTSDGSRPPGKAVWFELDPPA